MNRDSIFITGGAGFIGTNVAARFLHRGRPVIIYDNLSRSGAALNLRWLRDRFRDRLTFIDGDIRRPDGALSSAIQASSAVIHLAAQVAVTTSVKDPAADFETNARGTLNLLEAVRCSPHRPPLLYASTNKVYGGMERIRIGERNGRYEFSDYPDGISETFPLDFHSPYGCSKGAADQYVIDYSRIYGLRTVVFRQSCIYGPHQFGMEDQGWIAWFAIRALQGQPVTVFGDGRQVRDVLFVDDLIDAYELALTRIDAVSGRAYNIGGGPKCTLSLLELIALLGESADCRLSFSFADWRPGDQRVYVSDVRRAAEDLGWRPITGPAEGVAQVVEWLATNRQQVREVCA